MSELKTRFIDDTYAEYYNTGKHELAQVYLKEDVDKVIAEKDAKILALDAEVFKQKHHAKLFFDERNYAETQLHHSNYKRCLAMAKWCDAQSDVTDADSDYARSRWYLKWSKRWLKIADKLKDAK